MAAKPRLDLLSSRGNGWLAKIKKQSVLLQEEPAGLMTQTAEMVEQQPDEAPPATRRTTIAIMIAIGAGIVGAAVMMVMMLQSDLDAKFQIFAELQA
jgi:hypothetical protein